MLQKILFFLLFVCYFTTNSMAQITVTNSAVANTLVAKLVGSGVTYSNPTLTCASNGAGFFVSTNAMLGIDSGVILTTGYAKDNTSIVGVNNTASAFADEDRNFSAGDANLYALANFYNSSITTSDINDVCKLEFDFVPQGDTIRFKYKFGSEEYPDYVCSNFNDYFAFFITGTPGYASATNLAKVPGTNIPVTINSINSGTTGSQGIYSNCTNMGAGSPFPAYYQNTVSSNTVVYNGTTVLLEAKAVVTPCSTYHMKFVVADILDGSYDSGVFLKSGSFKSDGILFDSIHSPNALPIGWPYSTEGCNSDTIYVRRALPKPTSQIVYITLGGTAINGVDYATIPATVTIPANDTIAKIVVTPIQDGIVEATETLTIGLSSTNCNAFFSDTMTLLINEFPAFTVTDDDTICIGQSKVLSTTLAFANSDITFKWMPGNIIANSISITPLSSGIFTVTGRYPGCPNRDSVVSIKVSTIPTINAGIDTAICIGSPYTINAFGNTTAPYPVSYTWLPTATLSSANTLTTVATPSITTTYTITATNIAGCSKTDAIKISAKPALTLTSTNTPVNCANLNGSITVGNVQNGANISYTLLPNNTTNTTGIFTNLSGNTSYTATATSSNYCNTTLAIFLPGVAPVVVTNFVKSNITCFGLTNGNVNMTSSGFGAIAYNLMPSNTTNSSGIFTNLSNGTYTIIATDAQGCSTNTSFTIIEPAAILFSNMTNSPLICNGANTGFINAIANGGTGTINYLSLPNNASNSNGQFINLSAMTYTIYASDANGCSTNSNATINQTTAIIIDSISTQLAKCNPANSGIAAVYAVGGFGTFTYSANNGAGAAVGNVFNNLLANIYTVLVTDANSCTNSKSFIINQVLRPQFVNAIGANPTCNNGTNGSINTTIINTNNTINYTIIPSITNTNNGQFTNANAGVYTISLVDAFGCSNNTIVSLTQPSALQINTLQATPTLCNNTPTGTITISASGGTGGINYLLINNNNANTNGLFFGLGASNYTIQVADANGCSTVTNIAVVQPSTLNWSIINYTNVSCAGGANATINAQATGGTSSITYYLNNNASTPPYASLPSGNYTVVASDANGCSISTVVIVTQPNPLQFTNAISTALSCIPGNDATISTTITGGTSPYNYTLNGVNSNNTSGNFGSLNANIYTIVASDVNACTTVTIVNITNPIKPNIIAVSTTATGCIPNNTGTAIAVMANNVPSYSFTIGSGNQTNNLFTNLVINNYSMTVTDTLNCKDTATFTIVVTPNPSITNTSISAASCDPICDGVVNITASGGIGAFTYNLNTITQSSNVYTNLCPANYTAVVTDANGCKAVSIINIPIQPNPNIINVLATNISCNGANNGSITCSTIGGTPSYTFIINGANNGTSGSFTALNPNTYSIVVTDNYGCKDTAYKTVTQPNVLAITNIASIMPICFNSINGSISFGNSGGTGAVAYRLNNSAAQNNGVFNNIAGNATYTLSVVDANNCSSSTTLFLAQPNQLIFTSITTDSANCWSSTNGSITATATGGTGTITYSTYPSAASNTSGQFNNLFASIYSVTITDANNCALTSTTIVGQPLPLNFINITAVPVTCAGNNNGSIASTATGGIGAYSYTLLNSSTTNNVGNFGSLFGAIYTIQVSDAVGCSRASTISVYEPNALQYTNVLTQNNACFGSANGSIGATISGGNGGNVFSILPAILANNSTGTFYPLPSNNYTITTIDSKGCSTATTANITQPTALSRTITYTLPPICYNSSNGAITIVAAGGVPPYSYTILPTNTTNTNGQFINLSGNIYTVSVLDANNCSTSIAINLPAPLAVLIDSLQIKSVVCYAEQTGSIKVFSSGGIGNLVYQLVPGFLSNGNGQFSALAGGTYTVSVNDANNCSVSSAAFVPQSAKIIFNTMTLINPRCSGGTQGEINFTASGGLAPLQYSFNNAAFTSITNYNNLILGTYTIAIKDAVGCRIDTMVTLDTPLPLLLFIDSINAVRCIGAKDAAIYASAQFGNPGGYTFICLPANKVNTIGEFLGLAKGVYTVIARDVLGCEGITTVTITENITTIDIDFDLTPISCTGLGKDGILLAKANGGDVPYQYTWTLPTPSVGAELDSLSYGYYTVSVVDKNGCTATESILMPPSACCDLYLPNVFTPNSDGKNDVFKPYTSASIVIERFEIYDRFGNRVFSTVNNTIGWDGTYRNQLMDIDTYYYIFQYKCLYNNEVIFKKGDVILAK
jgi:large repetitive protein